MFVLSELTIKSCNNSYLATCWVASSVATLLHCCEENVRETMCKGRGGHLPQMPHAGSTNDVEDDAGAHEFNDLLVEIVWGYTDQVI